MFSFAQEQVEEEMIVRGIKSSLERSIDIKRESNQIVEAITADDIGKMPDQNVAESLQRLPGVQIDRT
ncbi:TonB-dependent receptor plug domain-containing protein [Teredinibacter purpureus]|uniref:TonB-dependent receptor plug domain-containing protein n=1 Tax=Teredinibacter purpureus TaxID=2731756 RepID=UPI0005F87023|nr:TonB-dependent receptor plug domain-containing protein [Teredinibacter purpureus]